MAFVEGALERTNPGKVFTVGVLAALPATLATSAKAATIAAAAAKGGATAKTAGAMGLLGVLATPLLIIFGNFIPYRMALAEAGSDEEVRRIKSYFHTVYAASFGLATVLTTALYFVGRRINMAANSARWICFGCGSSRWLYFTCSEFLFPPASVRGNAAPTTPKCWRRNMAEFFRSRRLNFAAK